MNFLLLRSLTEKNGRCNYVVVLHELAVNVERPPQENYFHNFFDLYRL